MAERAPGLLWLFFSFKGRIARQSFALGAGFLLLPQIFIILQIIKADETDQSGELALWGLVLLICAAATLWSVIVLHVKRLHDLDLHGAFAFIAMLSGINLVFFIFLACTPSKPETNKHGPPPFRN
jgi:uncharacterized membrane protein YhaH (DUF805 family)